MNSSFQKKLNLIYFPFVYYTLAFVLIYTFLNWLLFTSHHLFLLKQEVRNLIIPMALPWLPLFIWYRRRVKLLKLKQDGRRDPASAIVMLACFTVIATLIIAQEYMSTASGKLTAINSIQEISQSKETRYYTINNYVVDRNYTGSYLKKTVSGKYNQYLDLTLFIVCPIYDSNHIPPQDHEHHPISIKTALFIIDGVIADSDTLKKVNPNNILSVSVVKGAAAIALYGQQGKNGAIVVITKKKNEATDENDTAALSALPDSITTNNERSHDTESIKIGTIDQGEANTPSSWAGVKYSKTISNRLSAEEKEEKINDFKNSSWANYAELPDKGYIYFDEIPFDNDYIGFQKAASYTERYGDEKKFRLLVPKNEPFENRNGHKLAWIFGAFAIGSAILLLILAFVPLDDARSEAWLAGDAEKENTTSIKENLHWLIPKEGFYATPVIIYINVAIFLAMVFAGLGFIEFSAKDLLAWGGNFEPYIEQGQWWRLFTAIFLHAGLMHLLFNMYGLLFVGLFLEPVLGRNRFVIYYCVTGILANIVSGHVHPHLVGIGASGAIFGMYGIFLSFLFTGIFLATMKKTFLTSTLIFVGYNLIMGIEGGVDNAAHIGGLLSGLAIGLLISRKVKMEKEGQGS